MSRREQLEELLQSEPDDVFLNYALAKQCVSDGDTEGGLAGFARTLELDPNYVPAYFQQGQVLAEQGKTDSAREIIHAGIAVAQKVGDTHAVGEMTEFLAML